MGDKFIDFDSENLRQIKIDDNIYVRLELYGIDMSKLYFVDNGDNCLDLPTGFKLYDSTTEYINCMSYTVPILANKFYILTQKNSYVFVYKGKNYSLKNKRQWESNIKWEKINKSVKDV